MKKVLITMLALILMITMSAPAFAGSMTSPAKKAKYSAGSTITIKATPDASQCEKENSYCLVHIYSVDQKGIPVYENEVSYSTTTAITDSVTLKSKGKYAVYVTFCYRVNGFKNYYPGTGRYICGNRDNIVAHHAATITVEAKKVTSPKTSISSLKAAKKGFKATWKKKTCSGYQLRYSTKSSMSKAKTVSIKGAKATSKKITKLQAKKKYYVQVRTYKMSNGKKVYSAWSAKRSITTKK